MRRTILTTLMCGCVVAALLGAASTVRAETYVGGVILTDTTWDLAGSPYVVTVAAGGSIVVGGDATLTIEPGVEVRFEPLQALLVGWSAWGPGTLVARGTEQSPIVFTSIKDPNDPNDPAAPGDWSRIDFLDQATDATFDGSENYQSGCILEHVIVEYAGVATYPPYAAVHVEQSAPYLSYCEARQNVWRGIAVYSAPPLRIENCYVHDNQGGGIYFESSGSNTLTGNTISGNSGGTGGGIYARYSGSNTLTANTISGNSGGEGGGICLTAYSGSNTLTDNTISGNSASRGGAIYFGDYSAGNTLTGNTISGNSADDHGAGIYFAWGSGSNTLTANTISGNSAGYYGGGIYFRGSYNTLSGNRIEDNTAETEGGAICLFDSDNNAFAGNTVRFNHTTAGLAGGIFVYGGTEWLSLNGGAEAYNIICCNDGYEVYNNNTFYGDDARHDIDARNVFWGTDDTAVIQAEIYDFFDDASKAMVLWYPYVWPPPVGDLDADGDVDLSDLAALLGCYACCEPDPCYDDCAAADFDASGCVDLSDLAALLANYGLGT